MNRQNKLFSFVFADRSISFQFDNPDDYIAKEIIKNGDFYERDVLDEIAELPVPEGVFVDVGANIGNHSLFFSLVLNRKVVAFEPNQLANRQLLHNLQLNRVENLVTLHQYALGSRKGQGVMDGPELNLGAFRFTEATGGAVPLHTLDTVFSSDTKVALIKIDVEGYELEVLRGGADLLRRSKPMLIVETQHSADFISVSRYLSDFGYFPFAVKGKTPTVFFLHKDSKNIYIDRASYLIRKDVDTARRLVQSYLARIESSIKSVVTLDEVGKLSSKLDDRIAQLAEKIESKVLVDNGSIEDLKEIVLSRDEAAESLANFKVSLQEIENSLHGVSSGIDGISSEVAVSFPLIGEIHGEIAQVSRALPLYVERLESRNFEHISDSHQVLTTQLCSMLDESHARLSNGISVSLDALVSRISEVSVTERSRLLDETTSKLEFLGSSLDRLNDEVRRRDENKVFEGHVARLKAEIQSQYLSGQLASERQAEYLRAQLEGAETERADLESEVNRLLLDLHTERARTRFLNRRLNTLYTSGIRALWGTVKKPLSKISFGLIRRHETWKEFSHRLETRVARDVVDFKKFYAYSQKRAAKPVKLPPQTANSVLPESLAETIPVSSGLAVTRMERVRVGIASIEVRRTALSMVIDSLYYQVDELIIYLNDYAVVPEFLLREKIRVIHGEGDIGDRGKFFDIENFSGYQFTCDDDIIYPPYYVDHCIDAIERYGRKAAVGWHGSILKEPFNDYYSPESRRVFSFRSGRPSDLGVHVLGTGCVAFHTDTIDVSLADFKESNMADIYFALLGQEQQVPFVVVKHDANEAIPLEIPDDKPIHRESMNKTGSKADTRAFQNSLVKNRGQWLIGDAALTVNRKSFTIAYVGRIDSLRWKKGGILKSGGLIIGALRALGHRIIEIEISQDIKKISEAIKAAEIVWIYPGDPERPDFKPVEQLIEHCAEQKKQVYVNLSYNMVPTRTDWIANKISSWQKRFGTMVKACLFTYSAQNEPKFRNIKTNLITIPKSIDFQDGIEATFDGSEGIFLGDLQKLLNRNLVAGSIEDWINALKRELPGVKLYAVRQYGGVIDRDLGLEVLPYTHGVEWERWLAERRIVCCLTPHATYEMIPIEAAGLGVPTVYRPMPQSHTESIATSGVQVNSPEEFALACKQIYEDRRLWSMYSQAGKARARSSHISVVAASLHLQLALGVS